MLVGQILAIRAISSLNLITDKQNVVLSAELLGNLQVLSWRNDSAIKISVAASVTVTMSNIPGPTLNRLDT
jgi:hypothetical protein